MKERREFLKKLLKGSAVASVAVAAAPKAALAKSEEDESGVVYGKSKKKEILYFENPMWEKYYKTR